MENALERIAYIDNRIMMLKEEIDTLIRNRAELVENNSGYFIRIYSTDDGDEYYVVPKGKQLENSLQLYDRHEDWDRGWVFERFDRPYFQISDEEYPKWKYLADLISYKTTLCNGLPSKELKSEIFGGELEEIVCKVDEHISNLFHEIKGLESKWYQHVVMEN